MHSLAVLYSLACLPFGSSIIDGALLVLCMEKKRRDTQLLPST